MNDPKLLSPAEFHALRQSHSPCVVDVRNPDEFCTGSATDICWPLGQIDAASANDFVRRHGLQPDQPLVLLCASGKRARLAAAKLRELLPNPLAVLDGGQAALRAGNDTRP